MPAGFLIWNRVTALSGFFENVSAEIDQCMLVDRLLLKRKLGQLAARIKQRRPVDRLQADITRSIEQSQQTLAQRQAAVPRIHFPEQLPIAEKRHEIAAAISNHQVVIIAGETGSGKTTQIPKICLQLGRGVQALIGHTQPRRLAARSVAQRIADELDTPLGEAVGYQVRFNDQVSERSYIKLMTDGILLAEIQRDPELRQYDTLIIDEAHERSLNIDFLLGYLKQLLPRRPDLKLIITSATIDLESFSRHFDGAPVIEVSGRTFPVDVIYRPLADIDEEGKLAAGIEAALIEISHQDRQQPGDVLVFLSGEAEIREVARHLRKADLQHCEILPLYARLGNAEQNKIFSSQQRRGRRIILATNVAETSVTVPGIRYVIDPGYARISRYSYRSKLQRLPIEAISQASANQRKGRCGRVSAGVCVRLYSEEDFNGREAYTDPEIKRTNLASVILKMLSMGLGDIALFPYLDPPDSRQVSDGFKLLEELGATDRHRQLTALGKTLATMPVDPRFARMIIEGHKRGALREVLLIASALSVQDPRERPAEKQQAADEAHRRFQHKQSDFLAYISLWDYYEEQRQQLSQNQLRKLCQTEYISFMRMREWRDIHIQLRLICKEIGYRENRQAADYEAIHRSLLAGLLSHVAKRDEQKIYLGARNRKLRMFPASVLFKQSVAWVAAAEITETTQVYARCCAQIQPDWLLDINDALFKRSYSEPHWQQRTGRVMAYETMTLYGLVVRDRQAVHYGPIDSVLARELFIRAALVEANYKSRADFFLHNQQLIASLEDMEAKTRRRDILVDEHKMFAFYDERIPAGIYTARSFEKWLKSSVTEQPRLLFIERGQLIREGASQANEAQFPDQLCIGDLRFPLSYRFEPGHTNDGVTVSVPIGLLNRLPRYRLEWLVPGLLRDKCIALVKLLPKALRKQLVPVPDYVDRALSLMKATDKPLQEALSVALKQSSGVTIGLDSWEIQTLDDFYRVNVQVMDASGAVLGESRDIDYLLAFFRGQVVETLQDHIDEGFQKGDIREWNFGELPQTYEFQQAGVTVVSYPALVDMKDTVAIQLKDYPKEAEQLSRRGLVRLLILQMGQQVKLLRKQLLRGNALSLQLAVTSEQREVWMEDLLYSVFSRVFLSTEPLPRDAQAFRHCLQQGRPQLQAEAERAASLLEEIATLYAGLRRQMKKASQLAWTYAIADINQQLNLLFKKGFIADVPWHWLQQYPRYLQAIERRLEKLHGHLQRDKVLAPGLDKLTTQLTTALSGNIHAQIHSEELLRYRWLLEEYRVSLFAQQLGTLEPVSEKRLQEQWQRVQQERIDKPSSAF